MNAEFVKLPIVVIQRVRRAKLSGAQQALWLYLCELDPFGDRWVEIPNPQAIATELGVDERTIRRAAQRLEDLGLFEFEIQNWRGRNAKGAKALNFPLGNGIKMSEVGQKCPDADKNVQERTKMSEVGHFDPNVQLESPPKADSSSAQTIQTIQKIQQTQQTETTVVPSKQREMQELVALLESNNFNANKTIAKTLEQCLESQGSAAAAVVEAAIAAVKTQSARNPQGMLVVAIREQWQPPPNQGESARELNSVVGVPPPPENLPQDLGDLIARIDVECDRLGWKRKDAIGHMIERYRWRPMAFAKLTDADLYDMLEALQEL